MYSAEIDVPVMLWVWTRPEKIRRTFDVIRRARPTRLFLVSDGPRATVPADKEGIAASRQIVERIDWDCDVDKLYFEVNQGIWAMHKITFDFVFERVKYCIFLEDDIVPSLSFFGFCKELLERYENDLRVNMVGGMNHLGVSEGILGDYLFTKAAASWGFAFWRRTYETFYDFGFGANQYLLNRILENAGEYPGLQSHIAEYLKSGLVAGHQPGFEFYMGLSCFTQNQLSIVPRLNLVRNIGFGEDSAHSGALERMPPSVRRFFDMETYEYEFPLVHPSYVVEDREYERQVQTMMGARGTAWVRLTKQVKQVVSCVRRFR